MKVTRCVHIFPRFNRMDLIEKIRKEYDYLHDCIEGHITIVFPFESQIKKEILQEELKKIFLLKAFTIKAQGISAVDNFLFLNIVEGHELIKDLHYKSYSGLLRDYQSKWTQDGAYSPHLTLGRFKTCDEAKQAEERLKDFNESFEAVVDRIYVEIIGENDESIIEMEIKLQAD